MKKPMAILLTVGFLAAMIPILMLGLPISSCLQPAPPRPEITYGEFPFRLVYELNGEEIVVEDTVVCKFDGFGLSWGGDGKWRKWKSYLASNGEQDVLLLVVNKEMKIFYSVGGADYYMGDKKEYVYAPDYTYHQFPNAYYSNRNGLSGLILADKLLDKYGIKLISFEPSDPIQNTFK